MWEQNNLIGVQVVNGNAFERERMNEIQKIPGSPPAWAIFKKVRNKTVVIPPNYLYEDRPGQRDLFNFCLFSAECSRLGNSATVPSYSTLLMWRPGIELWSTELHHLEDSKFRTPYQASYRSSVWWVSLFDLRAELCSVFIKISTWCPWTWT